MVCVIFKLG